LLYIPSRSRIPLAGLFLAACVGVICSDQWIDQWRVWALLFLFFGFIALVWRRTIVTLVATALFFGFWHAFLIFHDQGFQLASLPGISGHVHRCVLCAESDSTPFHWSNQTKQRLIAEVSDVDGFPARFRVSAELNGNSIQYGDRVVVNGRLALPDEPLNPGEFDYRDFLKRQGVYLLFRAIPGDRGRLFSRGGANPVVGIARKVRHQIEDVPVASLESDPTIQGLIRGILFGDRSTISPDIVQELQDSGTLHLFVIDGLKMTLLAGLCWTVTRTARISRRWAFILVVPLFFYCAGTGLSIAGLRATIMSGILLFGIAMERPALAKNILPGAGLILLLLDPQQLFQLGFQLSFVTVGALIVGTKPIAHLLGLPFQPDPWIPQRLLRPIQRGFYRIARRGCELLAVCTICWLATLPFAWLTFHRISWCNVAANFATVPLGAFILTVGITSICVSPICRWASVCLNNTNWMLCHLFLSTVHGFTSLPDQSMNIGAIEMENDPRLVMLASGRSNTIYLHGGNVDCLINPGSDAKYRRIVQPFLRYEGVNRLLLLQSTRHDSDHEGCLRQLERHFACVLFENNVTKRIEIERTVAANPRLSTISLDGTGIRLSEESPGFEAHGRSILVQMRLYRILLMANGRAEARLDRDRLPVDLVYVSNPRSFSVTELRRKFDPQVIVYAQGKPIRAEQVPEIRTIFLNEQGAATLKLHGEILWLETFRGGQFAFRSRN
jgi:ComEC/Rec2-related protein